MNRDACIGNSNAIPPPVSSVSGPGDPDGGLVGPALPDRTVPTAIKARSSGWTSSRSWPWMTALLTARSGQVNNAKAALVDRRLMAGCREPAEKTQRWLSDTVRTLESFGSTTVDRLFDACRS